MLRGGNRGIVGFDPTTIPGCTVWFDAADPGTFGTSGTSLQTWRSKGSATCTASFTYNAPTVSTISGLSSIYFNGVSTMMNTNRIASYGATETTWITCAVNLTTLSASTPADACPIIATQGAGAERSIRYTCNVNATAYTVNTSVLRQTTGDNTNGVRGFIDTAAYFAGFTNGTMITSNTTAVTFQPGYNQGFVMGQWNVGWLNGYIYEILIYNRALSLGEYQSVEGYLSQKWGFSPAKAYVPTSIPGCALWLDGADPTGTGVAPANGATVSTWMDKSGNGRNASGGVSPTYNSSQKAITFNGSSWLTTSYSSVPTNETTFIVYQTTSAALANNCFMIGPTNIGGRLILSVNENDGFGLSFKIGSYGVANGSRIVQNQNQMYIGTITVASTTSYVYLNGTQGPSSTLTYSGTGTTQIGTAASGSGIYIGYIYEIVIYNTNLTTPQQQQIEGYLASKWGLQGSLALAHPNYLTTGNFVRALTLATTHPYYSLPPATRAFTPLDIPGCALWLDGADRSTFTGTTTITAWRDKSGNNLTLTATGTPTVTTVNGLNSLSFNGSSSFLLNPFTQTAGVRYISWFAVANVTNAASAVYACIVGTGYVSDNYTQNMMYIQPAGSLMIFYRITRGGTTKSTTIPLIAGNVLLSTAADFTAGNYQLFQNGIAGTLQTDGPTGVDTQAVILRVGHDGWGGDSYVEGTISEILLYTTPLTGAQRQQIEGYLANKWGLKASMPVFANPTSIPGCAMWLDGSDPAGTGVAPANNSAISTWVDKSGNGRNAVATSGTATFQTNIQNSLGSLLFSTQRYTVTYNSFPNSAYTFIILMYSTTANGYFISGPTDGYIYIGPRGGFFGTFTGIGSSTWNDTSTNTPNITTTNTWVIGDMVISGSLLSPFVNGTSQNTKTGTTGAINSFAIGTHGTINSEYFTGYAAEVLLYNTALSAAQRQQVEGYLAWKWGLQAQLPATHPFYATVPVPHPFNKVPPTIRQPALYSDVAPGNWAQDWQPYLRALTRANSTGVTVTTTNITGGATYGVGIFGQGAVLAPNGNMYGCPWGGGTSLLVLNPNTGTTSNLTGGATYVSNGWAGGVLAPNGNIYYAPSSATNILYLNPNTGVTSNITGGATFPATGTKWFGGVLAPNGNIYYSPLSSLNILVLNPTTGVTSNITGGATYPGGYAWAGGVLAPNGNIYFAPYSATNILVLNPDTGITSNITGAATYTGGGWVGGVLAPNGNIYFIPCNANNFLVLNPNTGVTSNLTGGATYIANGWYEGVLGSDGNIYGTPWYSSNIIVLNPNTGVTSNITGGATFTSAGWQGAVLAPNGNIYCFPTNATNILKITFSGLAQLPNSNYCLSAYTNKY